MTATIWADAELNDRADSQAARLAYISIHTALPTAGASEASGGSPAYARKAPTFSAAGTEGPLGPTLQPATVGVAWSAEMTFDLPAGSYTHLGAFTTITSGTFIGGAALDATFNPTGQDILTLALGVSYEGV